MQILHKKTDKKSINELPIIRFEGRIITIFTPGEAERAVDYLLTFPILGLDTETRPCFGRGKQNEVALLQVSTPDTCFLFRLNMIGFPPALIRLMEDERVVKVGLSLKDDFRVLRKRHDFTPRGYVELQELIKKIGVQDQSLQKMYANLFGQKISKNQQLSNWESSVLTDRQKVYAATDAWACIRIYEQILHLLHTQDYQLIDNEKDYTEEG